MRNLTPEARAKMGAANKGRSPSPETLAKRSASLKGHPTSQETKAKISAALKGRQYSAETLTKMSVAKIGTRNSWKGGRRTDFYGYIYIFSPDHPYCTSQGYVLEHRLVMEVHLGRTLLPEEVVHHINSIRDDNRIENLMRFESNKDHLRWHKERERKK
jgi:hypothetical protein